MIKILYFGSNEYSATVLEALVNHQGFDITGVVTQPPRPVGRKQIIEPTPVQAAAERLGLPIIAEASLKKIPAGSFPAADVALVYAYGILIPEAILTIPRYGTLNIHPSLLPKYRGTTPVQSALINGETETGASIMLLDAEMDHGPILKQTKIIIGADDTADRLTEKIISKTIPELLTLIPAWIAGEVRPTPQNHEQATYTKIFTRDDGKIDFSKSAQTIYNQFRGLTPWPGVWITWNGQRLKLIAITPSPKKGETAGIVFVEGSKLYIGTTDAAIEVTELQLEGKKAMNANIFINGYPDIIGTTLK